jgi:hypothetical protein
MVCVLVLDTKGWLKSGPQIESRATATTMSAVMVASLDEGYF